MLTKAINSAQGVSLLLYSSRVASRTYNRCTVTQGLIWHGHKTVSSAGLERELECVYHHCKTCDLPIGVSVSPLVAQQGWHGKARQARSDFEALTFGCLMEIPYATRFYVVCRPSRSCHFLLALQVAPDIQGTRIRVRHRRETLFIQTNRIQDSFHAQSNSESPPTM